MRKISVLVALITICFATFLIVSVLGQGKATLPAPAEENRAEVSFPVQHDTSQRPLRDMPDKDSSQPARGGRDFEPGRPEQVGNSNPVFNDPLAKNSLGFTSAFAAPKASTIGTEVDPTARVAPPDTTGDLGLNHYVQWVNLRYAIYTVARDANNGITGFSLVSGFPKKGNVVWSGFGGACEANNDGDPIVQYDQLNNRWILTQFAVSTTPYTQCVAVSTSSDPTGTYNRYAYSYGTDFNDYPKMGVWGSDYYITYNMFKRGRTFAGNKVCAFEGANMRAGTVARQVCAQTSTSHASLLPADLEGTTLPPAGSPNFLLSMTSTAINFWKFTVSWAGSGSGTLTGPTAISGVTAFSRACGGGTCIPQPGTTQKLDSLADRLMYRLSYRNFGDHEMLLVNHSVASGSGTGVRWYELRNATGQSISSATPVVYQQGTFAPDSNFRWMGSAAMDKNGGIAVGYNISNATTIKPGIRYAYRAAGDTLGTLANETEIIPGPGSQTGNSLSRWGDYSTISVDPVDKCTFVFTTEYIPSDGSFNWSTYIHSFKLSSCQ